MQSVKHQLQKLKSPHLIIIIIAVHDLICKSLIGDHTPVVHPAKF